MSANSVVHNSAICPNCTYEERTELVLVLPCYYHRPWNHGADCTCSKCDPMLTKMDDPE